MKGAIAAALLAFRDADPAGELVFASFVGEEVGGGPRCTARDRAGFSPDYAVVGEDRPTTRGRTSPTLAVAHKGRRGSTITTHGTAAHASVPTPARTPSTARPRPWTASATPTPSVDAAGETLEAGSPSRK